MIKRIPAKVEIVSMFCDKCGTEMRATGEVNEQGLNAYQCKNDECGARAFSPDRYPYSDIVPLTDEVNPS